MNDSLSRWWREHGFTSAALAVALVALAASLTGMWNGFAYDDVIVIRDNPAVHALRSPLAFFGESYWGPARGEDALYRPATVFVWSLQWAAAGGKPWLFHAVNIALYMGTTLALLALLRRLVTPGAAVVAAALFAAHPVHVEAVANVVGQAELWVSALSLAALVTFAQARMRGPLGWRTAALIASLYALSLLFKENGIVLPALLLIVEWAGQAKTFHSHETQWRRARLLALTLGVIAALYLLLRNQVLGAVTGDHPVWALVGLSAAERWLVMLGLLPEIVRLLFWPARLYADYSPTHTPVLSHWDWGHLPGVLILVALITACTVAWRRRQVLPLVGLAWFVASFAPVSNVVFASGVLLAERTLLLPSVGIAFFAAWLVRRAVDWPRPTRAAAIAVGPALVALGTAHSAQRTRVWSDNPTLFSTLAVEAPGNYRAVMALADFHAKGGSWPTADSLFQEAMRIDPGQLSGRLTYVAELMYVGRCDRALPLARAVMREDSISAQALVSTVICLLAAQRFQEARAVGVYGSANGSGSPVLRRLRVVTDSMLVVTDSVDARNRFWREGRPFLRGGGPLQVTVNRETLAERRSSLTVQAGRRSARPPESPSAPVTP